MTLLKSSWPSGANQIPPYFFTVPDYQRDFAWTAEEVDDLWQDITNSLSRKNEEYFLGAIVLSDTNNPKIREIVDGQQRLASLSMIFAAIRNAWEKRLSGVKQAAQVSDLYLGNVDRATQKVIPKLTLNANNRRIFQEHILDGMDVANLGKLSKSDKLVHAAFKRIEEHLDIYLKKSSDPLSQIVELEDFLSHKVQIITIETLDDSDAFIIFETLNDRGMDLAVADLVKNYLFSKAGKNLDQFKDQWREIVSDVGSQNITSFLRYVWLAENKVIREKELYKNIRQKYSTSTDVKKYIDMLTKRASQYSALRDENHEYWNDFYQEIRQDVAALNKFKVSQFIPLAFAVIETGDKKFIAEMINILTAISLRYTVISGYTTNNLENTYNDATLKVNELGALGFPNVKAILRRIYVDDSEFKEKFSQRDFTTNDIPKHILVQINSYMQGDNVSGVREHAPITLEHIAPKTPNAEWKTVIPDDVYEDIVLKIGNMTLLDRGINRKISNSGWSNKKSIAIDTSLLSINDELKTIDTWNKEEIIQRGKRLAEIACEVWKVNFDV
ncbi:hypothetical protein Dxin01_01388 [Deinococcus xinjiangensis]|uniref:DUF262 domain-containing protein n=1 Tax=Deinococcus xinjiangensis TaxID=457454 RepID=A0ABP9VD59_9DEIO